MCVIIVSQLSSPAYTPEDMICQIVVVYGVPKSVLAIFDFWRPSQLNERIVGTLRLSEYGY